jgi:polyvinyl alcohol dehydrogenase (cytochrome)
MMCAPACLLGGATTSATENAHSPGPVAGAPSGSLSGQLGSWTIYHGTPAGTGAALGVRSVNTAARAWTSPTLDGQIYGEPLALDQSVYVATENDTVYALSSLTGSVQWSVHLGTPVPATSLPCSGITPTVGITGTPVIDLSRREIFVVADILATGGPAHILFGLSTTSGKSEMAVRVDPPLQDPAAILQRTALTLTAGQVVFGFGGNMGDCGTYRGRLVAVPESGGQPRIFTVDAAPDESHGAIWLGGAAPAVDGHGNLWVGTGNGSVQTSGRPYDYSDGVLEFSPSLRLLQFFAPASWPQDNALDIDLAVEPVLLADGQVLGAGKPSRVYLLNGARLGGIGGQQAMLLSACNGEILGGSAVAGMTVYLPCTGGIAAVQVTGSPPRLRMLWKTATGGGPPVLAAGLVWTIGQNGTLYGLAPATGKIRQQVTVGVPANHFPTPGVGAGLMLVPGATNVIAFAAPAGQVASGPAAAAATPGHSSQPGRDGRGSSQPAGDHGASSQPAGDHSRPALTAAAALGVVVIGGASWLIWRRRTGRTA